MKYSLCRRHAMNGLEANALYSFIIPSMLPQCPILKVVATSEIQLATHYKRFSGNTVLSLVYDHPQNHIGVVVKEGWSSARDLTIL